jgi:CBS domain-containing protein
MRLREVMSSPVVTVAPGTHLQEVADLLVRHEISAVPVVEVGELVGIVSEADLVPLGPAPDPAPTSPRSASRRRAWSAR